MFKKLLIATVIVGLLSGCTHKNSGAPGSSERVVNLAIWSNYVSSELLDSFEKKTGIKVQVSNYSSNEELLAKLQAGASGYDVAVPSDYMVTVMSHLGLLVPLDRAQIPNVKHVSSEFLGRSYDPKNEVSLPYDWGTTGIAVNRELYKGKITGWKDLFTKADLAGKFSLLDDPRETLGAALKSLGLSLDSRSPEEIARAKELLLRVRPAVKEFTSEPLMPLVNGEISVAHAYMSDALQARRKSGGKIEYVLPVEGGTLWIDNLVIPKGGAHLREAHAFINFLLEPSSAVQTVKSVLVAPTVMGVRDLLPPELRRDPALFPAPGALKKFETMQDLGEAISVYDRAWTEVKAGE
jgi:spermidine/putrescine transport system substrate-binding protein